MMRDWDSGEDGCPPLYLCFTSFHSLYDADAFQNMTTVKNTHFYFTLNGSTEETLEKSLILSPEEHSPFPHFPHFKERFKRFREI